MFAMIIFAIQEYITIKSKDEIFKDIKTIAYIYIMPFLMITSTSFTLQCIGHALLDSRRFYRVLGGSIASFGMISPLIFITSNTTITLVSLLCSIILSSLISLGYLCSC